MELIDDIYNYDEGKISLFITGTIIECTKTQNFAYVDALLELDPNKLSVQSCRMLLRSTFQHRHKLRNWARFLNATHLKFKSNNIDTSILRGILTYETN